MSIDTMMQSTTLAQLDDIIDDAEDAYAHWILTQPAHVPADSRRAQWYLQQDIAAQLNAIGELYAQREILVQGGRVWVKDQHPGKAW